MVLENKLNKYREFIISVSRDDDGNVDNIIALDMDDSNRVVVEARTPMEFMRKFFGGAQ